jgi:hypothetical protein
MSSTTATTEGSKTARDVGILRAAFVTDTKWDNTWNIMREYNRSARDNTGPPPFAATWTEMEKTLTPIFQQTEIPSSTNSPLSTDPSAEAVKRFNHAVRLVAVYERNSTNSKCQDLVTWFRSNENRIGAKDFQETVFLRHAFDTRHHIVMNLTTKTYNDFYYAWAELEVGEEYNDPVFPMEEGLTNAASPVISGDWTIDAYTLEKLQWERDNPARAPGSRRLPRQGNPWG